MKRITLYSWIFFALVFNSCKKKELPNASDTTTDDTPVFYFKCDVNGTPIVIQAGVNDYRMNASYYMDINNVFVYKGELKQQNCTTNCGFALSVLINDFKVSSATASLKPDSGLVAGSYGFNDGYSSPSYYTGTFSPVTAAPGSMYQWRFSDGNMSTTQSSVRQLSANKTYSVYLSSNDPKGCVSTHMNVFRIGNPVQTNIHTNFAYGVYSFYTDNPADSSAYSYFWEFGDGATSTSPMPDHAYAAPTTYTTRLTMVNSSNDSCISYYQVNAGNTCESNFSAKFTPVPNLKLLSTITILVTDQNGTVYSSGDLHQPTTSKFEIVSVEEYKHNEKDEPTKKVKIRFNCVVNNGSVPILINNGEAVIAVSYK